MSEASDLEHAAFFVVETYDPEIDRRYHHGPFPTAPEAMEWAETHLADVNRAVEKEDDLPWEVAVYPVWNPND